MDLKQKGESAAVGNFKQLLVSMKWTTAADFDLAAAYEKKDGTKGLIYFGELGDLNSFPYMQLSGDEGVGDSGGDNEETMRITQLDEIKNLWIFCWDYGQVQKGGPARFSDSDVKLSVMDDRGTTHNVSLETGMTGNVACIATITNGPVGAQLVNTSSAGTLKGLSNLQQLLDVVL